VRCDGLVRVSRGERVTRSCPPAHYPLASGGAASLSPCKSVRSCRLCGGSRFSLQVNSSALRQRAGGAGASLCSPVLVHPPQTAKKPLEARLSNGWSRRNAPGGLCPPRRPCGDGRVCGPPSLGCCASPLVMGVAGSGGELRQLPCQLHPRGWVAEACEPVWVGGGLVAGDADGVCQPQGNGSTYWGYFPASARWHPAQQGFQAGGWK